MPVSAHSAAQRIAPDNTNTPGSLACLHSVAWGCHTPEVIFRPMKSPKDDHTILCWERDSIPALLLNTEMSSILVRDEYPNALRDIISVAQCHGDLQQDEPLEAMEVDRNNRFYNPFVDMPPFSSWYLAAIVLGNSGIGKTMFLYYDLALRTLAGLPSMLQLNSEELFVFCNEGVFVLPFPRLSQQIIEFCTHIPHFVWVLVDSTLHPKGVHSTLYELYCSHSAFILQTASPRWDCTRWRNKTPRPAITFWILNSCDTHLWSHQRPPEHQLTLWCKKYGASARQAYAYAAHVSLHAPDIAHLIRSLAVDKNMLTTMLANACSANVVDERSHDIYVIAPVPGDRMRHEVRFAIPHLLFALLEQLEAGLNWPRDTA
ncbi:uncharacterized protein FIBRA_06845 [Fibroporia radiculosa]|uniref:Uncharacterized protein n=1 Tax=Fibroporia radiculosa TaxID=599839 RepID=J4IBH3_9APHY|nr:uncharacterized protein FIBRA_06845 [Fibroporia radiculosa]CCM04661.1 predicted protein [Fibroporia radiculosa]